MSRPTSEDNSQFVKLTLPSGIVKWMTREDYRKLYAATMAVFQTVEHYREAPTDADIVEFEAWEYRTVRWTAR